LRWLLAAERAEHGHLGRLEALGDALGVLDQNPRHRAGAALAHEARVDLHGDQDLVLLRDPGGGVDQLQVGLDHRRAP
jgi:hypothetical protein